MLKLTGTEKQVAWAESIRTDNIKTLERELAELKDREVREDWDYSNITAKIEKAIEELKNDTTHTEAKWWIEHRGLAQAFMYNLRKGAK